MGGGYGLSSSSAASSSGVGTGLGFGLAQGASLGTGLLAASGSLSQQPALQQLQGGGLTIGSIAFGWSGNEPGVSLTSSSSSSSSLLGPNKAIGILLCPTHSSHTHSLPRELRVRPVSGDWWQWRKHSLATDETTRTRRSGERSLCKQQQHWSRCGDEWGERHTKFLSSTTAAALSIRSLRIIERIGVYAISFFLIHSSSND
jgi:hypothetical protein